jgi:pimeloyl-ACP methyl ester carboxylesterase
MPETAFALPTRWGQLAGSMVLPAAGAPFPVVLLIAGSGPTDRDGNNPQLPVRIDNLKLLAEALAARGIATLRYDKRGVGGSGYPGLSEEALRFDDLVDDAVVLARALRDDARFSGVALLGHSEGALIAALAATAAGADAVVSASGAGERASVLMRKQIQAVMPPDLSASATGALDALEAGRAAEDVPDELVLLFRPTVQPYLISWFRHHPAEVLAALDIPLLLVHGSADVQVPVQHARLLHEARPDARLCVVDGMDHLLAVSGDVRRGTVAVADEVRALLAVPVAATSASP